MDERSLESLRDLVSLSQTILDMEDYSRGRITFRSNDGVLAGHACISPDPRTVRRYRKRIREELLPGIAAALAALKEIEKLKNNS